MFLGLYKHLRSRVRLPYNILKCRMFNEYKPLVVLLYVTDRCNLRCKYCVGNWSGRKIKDFTINEIFKIADDCKKLGTIHFTIHGGEIFLRNDVRQIIDYLKRNNFYVNLVTNGILLPEKIDEIKNIDSLCISLDGTEENHDYNRGQGSYKAAIKAIKLAKEKDFKFVVQSTLTQKGVKDIHFLCKQAKEIGYYQQFSLLLKPLDHEQSALGLSDADAKDAILSIIKMKKEGYPVFTSYRTLENALNWPFFYEKSRLTKKEYAQNSNLIRCFYGKLKVAIDADGFVYPCSSLNDSFKALNVKEVGIKKAYERVLNDNNCEACYYLTQNDWSLLLGGDLEQFAGQIRIQFRGIFNIF